MSVSFGHPSGIAWVVDFFVGNIESEGRGIMEFSYPLSLQSSLSSSFMKRDSSTELEV